MTSGRGRYAAAGPVYDVVSLERALYRRPRLRLVELLALPAGATVLDLGCGTGLNLPPLLAAVGPRGRVLAVDASASMVARADRRVRAAGWGNVTLLTGDAADLPEVFAAAGIPVGRLDAVLATFVLSVVPDTDAVWAAVDAVAAGPVRVGVADLGPATTAAAPLRRGYDLLARAGGADLARRPWEHLVGRTPDLVEEPWLSGHVHLAAGTYHPPAAARAPAASDGR